MATAASALSIAQLTGTKYLSPYQGQAIKNVTGIVTGKLKTGLFLQGQRRACDTRIANGVYVYSSSLGTNTSIEVGDTLTVDGYADEYRSDAGYLYLLEIGSPKVTKLVKGDASALPKALVIGKDTSNPPTEQFSSLDGGDVFGVPNNASQLSVVNPTLEPETYGLDFWKSLSGERITIESPVAIAKPNQYAETWVIGNWKTSGKNGRGGLTLASKDGNPEAIIVGSPLDGSKNKDTYKIGDQFNDITGIVHYQFGFFYILPTTNLTRISSAEPELPPPTSLTSTSTCSGLTIGDYNIENFAPSNTKHVTAVASHIANYLKTPDLLFVQEIQDNNGATADGLVDANVTLNTLTAAIKTASGVSYEWTQINPVNGSDGGQPGGNIRVAYLYKPDVIRLRNANPGGSLDANEVLAGPTLKYNPGRIDPTNAVFVDSRKPLAAEWETVDGKSNFFTVNVHWESKGGSSSLQGDLRPPVNLPVEKRTQQANITATFVAQILAQDPSASVIVAGDCNEYSVVQPITTFLQTSKLVDLDVAANIELNERYTYTFGSSMEELDHVFVSQAIADKGVEAEHIHVNTWVNYDDATSDHDPTVAKINVCKA
ncbi:DNase I-like protein [Thozetella sp. PMI_491]|nr:DNase I-like protein [Thozetella sp. PMI_491]